jgi:hypothetical protein
MPSISESTRQSIHGRLGGQAPVLPRERPPSTRADSRRHRSLLQASIPRASVGDGTDAWDEASYPRVRWGPLLAIRRPSLHVHPAMSVTIHRWFVPEAFPLPFPVPFRATNSDLCRSVFYFVGCVPISAVFSPRRTSPRQPEPTMRESLRLTPDGERLAAVNARPRLTRWCVAAR